MQSSENMAALGTIISFLLFRPLVWAGESCSSNNSENGFALVDHVYRSFFADRLVSCYMSCSMQPACQSLNYNLADKTCEFNNDTKYFRPKYFVEKPTNVYADNPDSGAFLFLLLFYFFKVIFQKIILFLYFVHCPLFLSFFLTGKNVVTCEVCSCKKKKNIKKKKNVIAFITQYCQAREFRNWKILLNYVCGFHSEDVAPLLFLLCKLRKHGVGGRQ